MRTKLIATVGLAAALTAGTGGVAVAVSAANESGARAMHARMRDHMPDGLAPACDEAHASMRDMHADGASPMGRGPAGHATHHPAD